MRKGELPESRQVGSMVELPAPCGRHVVYYPAELARRAIQQRTISVFETFCECDVAYLVATQPDGAHFRAEGPPVQIMERYEALPWPEGAIADPNGIFRFKAAPSLAELQLELDRRLPR